MDSNPHPQRTTLSDADFVALLEENRQGLLRLLATHARSREEQEEWLQEIVFQAWRGRLRFRNDSRPRTWLYQIALHVALRRGRDRARRSGRQRSIEGLTLEVADDTPSVEEDAVRREEIARRYACIARLPQVDRALVGLHLEGLAHAEIAIIAGIAGITENHVAARVGRARRKLQHCLERKES